MSEAKGTVPDIAAIQPDRLIKYRISEDRFHGEVLLPGLWYTDFDRKIGGKWTFWSISKTFEAMRWYGWMNGLFSYYELVSGRNRTFFNASTIIQMEKEASDICFDSHFGVSKPFKFQLSVSHIGNTSFTYLVEMFDQCTGIRYGRCLSKVVYVDAKTRRPVRLPEKLISGAKTYIESRKITPQSVEKMGLFDVPKSALPYKLKVLHSDCDRNLHVNQSTYIRWCSDALCHHLSESGYLSSSENSKNERLLLKELTVQYIGEALVNDNIIVYTWATANQILFAIINGERKQIFNAKLLLYDFDFVKNCDIIISKL